MEKVRVALWTAVQTAARRENKLHAMALRKKYLFHILSDFWITVPANQYKEN